MAETSCKRFLFFLFLIPLLFSIAICCAGTVVGSYDSRSKTVITLIVKALSTRMQIKASPFHFQVLVSDHGVVDSLSNTDGSTYICLKQTQHVINLRSYKAIFVLGSNAHLRSHILEIPSVTVSYSSLNDFPNENELQMLLPILKSTKSLLNHLHRLKKPVKVSVTLPLSLLNTLNMKQKTHVDDILHYIRKTKSFLIVEDSVDGEWNNPDDLIHSILKKSNLVISLLSHANVPIILSIKTSVFPSPTQSSALYRKIQSSLKNNPQVLSTLTFILLELSPTHSRSSRRELLTSFNHKTILHDSLYPPTTNFPTNPITNPTTPITNPTTPTTLPPYNPTPTIVTIPGTNPVSGTPALPYTNPVPSTTPVSIPPTTPSTIPVAPATDPGTQPVTNPVTNPVTTYPPPSTVDGGVPSTTSPVTTPVTAPAATNAPIIPGQTWCVARTGAAETALQSALDYACGIGGADCLTIQEGASCYNPNTLENHASYAFNSYFQKNPGATSCDFGGTAVLVNTNPSSGTCMYPSSATTTAPSIVPPATTASTSGATGTGSSYGSPPSVLNTSSSPIPGSSIGYGDGTPPILTAPPSGSAGVQPFFGFVLLTTSLYMTVFLGV